MSKKTGLTSSDKLEILFSKYDQYFSSEFRKGGKSSGAYLKRYQQLMTVLILSVPKRKVGEYISKYGEVASLAIEKHNKDKNTSKGEKGNKEEVYDYKEIFISGFITTVKNILSPNDKLNVKTPGVVSVIEGQRSVNGELVDRLNNLFDSVRGAFEDIDDKKEVYERYTSELNEFIMSTVGEEFDIEFSFELESYLNTFELSDELNSIRLEKDDLSDEEVSESMESIEKDISKLLMYNFDELEGNEEDKSEKEDVALNSEDEKDDSEDIFGDVNLNESETEEYKEPEVVKTEEKEVKSTETKKDKEPEFEESVEEEYEEDEELDDGLSSDIQVVQKETKKADEPKEDEVEVEIQKDKESEKQEHTVSEKQDIEPLPKTETYEEEEYEDEDIEVDDIEEYSDDDVELSEEYVVELDVEDSEDYDNSGEDEELDGFVVTTRGDEEEDEPSRSLDDIMGETSNDLEEEEVETIKEDVETEDNKKPEKGETDLLGQFIAPTKKDNKDKEEKGKGIGLDISKFLKGD